MNFHRYYIPGSAIFITQVVQNRVPVFRDPNRLDLLLQILHNVKELHPFILLGYVFLFVHFHIIIQPTGKSNFSDIMHSLKPNFTREYKNSSGIASSQTVKFWQKRFWDHVIRNDRDLENHLHYIHSTLSNMGMSKIRVTGNIAVIWSGRNLGYIRLLLVGKNRKIWVGVNKNKTVTLKA